MWDKIKGGLYGLLIGDALGVPYEFRSAEQLPPLEQIEFTPPVGFQPTYRMFQPAPGRMMVRRHYVCWRV